MAVARSRASVAANDSLKLFSTSCRSPSPGNAGPVFHPEIILGATQPQVMLTAQGVQPFYYLGTLPSQPSPFPDQFTVPEYQFLCARPSFPAKAKQPVSLLHHPLVPLQRLQVKVIGLGNKDVQEFPPD